jgi:hypothetical protein
VYSAKLDQLAQLSESRRSESAIKVSMQDDIISFIRGDSFRKASS